MPLPTRQQFSPPPAEIPSRGGIILSSSINPHFHFIVRPKIKYIWLMNRNYKIYNQVLNERIYAGASGYCLGFVVPREGIRAAAAVK